MAIIGALIKKAIEIGQTFTQGSIPIEQQRAQLKSLLSSAKDTAFGQYYGFGSMLSASDFVKAFQAEVPIHNYDSIRHWWQQQQKYPNITWPGKPDYFALSSGTTGKESKRIPVTDEMLKSFQGVSMAQIISLNNFDFPAELFEKQLLGLGSSADLEKNNGHFEGEISGINAKNAPDWFDYFYKPGKNIAKIDDWDERLEAIVQEAPDWDIGALAGIPSWILLMLKAIVNAYRLDSIHDIWPGLSIFTSGGVAFEPYRESFEQLFAKPVTYMDTYLASEGYFAFTARPGTMAMQLALDYGLFFEFIPFDEEGFDSGGNLLAEPKVLTIDQVEEDKDYALIVSTPAGAWRYMIGDTVKFTDLKRSEILISGRTKYYMNVVGSQLSEEKLNKGIEQLAHALDIEINEFAVAALKNENDEYYHQWVLGSTGSFDEEKACKLLDEFLKELNKNYKVARSKALKSVTVKYAPKKAFYEWLDKKKKKGGQVKVPKVMSAEKMQSFLKFLEEEYTDSRRENVN